MPSDLLAWRQRAIDRYDAALNRFWPDKNNPEFRAVVTEVVRELEQILAESKRTGLPPLEQSRTARWLGDAYSDLSREQRVSQGEDLAYLSQAVAAYQHAEALLPAAEAPRDEAVLNFNYANSLRRFDIENLDLLHAARRRYERALELFQRIEPARAPDVRSALDRVLVAIQIAPLSRAVQGKIELLEEIQERLQNRAAVQEIRQLLDRFLADGGPMSLARRIFDVVNNLPESVRRLDKDGKLQGIVAHALTLTKAVQATESGQTAAILDALRQRLEREIASGQVDPSRAQTLRAAVDRLSGLTATPADDIETVRRRMLELRHGAGDLLPALREMSYGLPSLPPGSRAAAVRKLWWPVREAVIGEIIGGGKGERERSVAYDVAKRTTEADKRLMEAGDDDAVARKVEMEAVRPLAVQVRRFASRTRLLLAAPIWPTSIPATDANAVVFAGRAPLRDRLRAICKARGLELLVEPRGPNVADERWTQIARAGTGIFDFGVPDGPELAAVAYELGIAQTVGKPVVVARRGDRALPFDIDVTPVAVGDDDVGRLEEVLDRAVYWMPPGPARTSIPATVAEVRRRFSDSADVVKQALKTLRSPGESADPLAVWEVLESLSSFLGKAAPVVVTPAWIGRYPEPGSKRVFHVMPFGPPWADEAVDAVSRACQDSGSTYIRGDKVLDPQVLQSIFLEICQATHVLVDLTGFNANVAFELGVAHTLGRPTLMVGQEEVVERLFPAIAKLRVLPYRPGRLKEELSQITARWLSKGDA